MVVICTKEFVHLETGLVFSETILPGAKHIHNQGTDTQLKHHNSVWSKMFIEMWLLESQTWPIILTGRSGQSMYKWQSIELPLIGNEDFN
jgi:hypothetical protein